MSSPLTTDTFYNGLIRVKQKRSGYRYSIDAILLAHHVQPKTYDTVLDLGTGCGIIPLILAYHHPTLTIFGVEIQPELARIASCNVNENAMGHQIQIIEGDMNLLQPPAIPASVNLVVSNPPYRSCNTGRINPDKERAVARHEIKVALEDVIAAACRMLSIKGRFVIIYPARRMVDLLTTMRKMGMEPKTIRMVHSFRRREASLVIVKGIKGGRSQIEILPPLTIYEKNKIYTREVQQMLGG
jgi:tRNA1Val (adenine37-N6)-methyltransferase